VASQLHDLKNILDDMRAEISALQSEIQAFTDRIMDVGDNLASDAVKDGQSSSSTDDTGAQGDKLSVACESYAAQLFEACAIHDVLRQRLDKIARMINRIEDPTLAKDDPLLAGPQVNESGLSQDDINSLLDE
jgi:hypothetical protein